MNTLVKIAAAMAMALLLSGCDGLPKDPEGTLERVRGGTLRVGIGYAETELDTRERSVIGRLAQRLGARIEWRRAEAHTLFDDLSHGRIDLVAGGIPQDTPFREQAGLSAPVSGRMLDGRAVDTVFAVRRGENGFLTALENAIGENP